MVSIDDTIILEARVASFAKEAVIQQSEWEKFMKLMEKLKAHHELTYRHSLRVGISAYELAIEEEWGDFSLPLIGGIAHDLGKCCIHKDILNKNGELSAEEWEIIMAHPQTGYEMLQKDFPLPALVAGLHHRFQPNAYGLVLSDIPDRFKPDMQKYIENTARLIRLVDFHDAYTTRTDRHEHTQHDPSWLKNEENHMELHIPNYKTRLDCLYKQALPK